MRKTLLMLAAVALLALSANAATTADLQAEATSLLLDYQVLSATVEDCPDGRCGEAPALLERAAALDALRADLHRDRESLGTGGCTQIDSLIAQIDQLSDALSATLGGWDEDE